MRPIYRHTFLAAALAAMPALALAEDAFTLQPTEIFAGPSSEFPQIASLPPNTEVGVAGCLSDWSWCDVTFANDRGWMWAGDLGYPYDNQRVAIIEYGPRLRLPVVGFSINTYWDQHYRSRPFYRERETWVSRAHIEGGHGGTPPHGGTRVARPAGGPAPSAQNAPRDHAQSAQGMQRPQESAQREGDQRAREQADQRAREQGDQRAREEAAQRQNEQRGRQEAQHAQPNQPQASERGRAPEESNRRQGQPEARAQERDQRAAANAQHEHPTDQHAQAPEQSHSMSAQERPGATSAQNEAMRGQPDRGASAKGPQNEAARGQPDRGANAKGPQGERPKEEERERNPQ